jgi:hypothetical protein
MAGAVAAAALTVPALAQTRDRAGDPQVFERGRDDAVKGPKLDATIDVASAYDSNLPTAELGQLTTPLYSSGVYTTLAPNLYFTAGGDRVHFNLLASSNIRHYADAHQVLLMNQFAGGGVTAQVTRQTAISFNQLVTYAPTYLNGLFSTATPVAGTAGALVAPDGNSIVDVQRSYAYSTTAGLTHNFTSRAAVLFNASFRYTDYIGQNTAYPDYRSYDGGGQFRYSVSRHVRLQLDYKLTHAETFGTARTREDDLTVGLNYDLPLSRTRKTTIAFSVGPTLASGLVSIDGDRELRRQYRVSGDASMSHDLGRTWTARANYHRGMGFIEGIPEPAYSAAYTANVDGFLNRRSELSLSAGYSTGEAALIGALNPFSSYTGSSRLQFALGREWASYVQYVYYNYNFNEGFLLPPGVPRVLSRGGVRVGLALWLPMRHR